MKVKEKWVADDGWLDYITKPMDENLNKFWQIVKRILAY